MNDCRLWRSAGDRLMQIWFVMTIVCLLVPHASMVAGPHVCSLVLPRHRCTGTNYSDKDFSCHTNKSNLEKKDAIYRCSYSTYRYRVLVYRQ